MGGSRGFGLSLIYRGLDKYEEKDTGIFVARVVPGGQAARYGVRENDKILTINSKTPRNVDDAVGVIKQAGSQIKLVVLREEDGAPDITTDEVGSVASGDVNSTWGALGSQQREQPISRSGSARSFNTSFGRPPASPSPRPPRAHPQHFGQPGQSASLPGHPQGGHNQSFQQQQEFLRQQQEYKAQQERQQQLALAQQAAAEQQKREQLQQQVLLEQQRRQQEQERQDREREQQVLLESQKRQEQQFNVGDTVKGILNGTDFGSLMERPQSAGNALHPGSRIVQETKRSTENITRTITETAGPEKSKYKSTQSLHELGLDNYPNPDMPESSRLSRKEEKQSLQNLNNRLAGYIDRVRTLQKENYTLTKQIKCFEEHQTTEITHVKDMYNKQIDDLKAALDSMNKQYNQLKVGAEGLLQENEDIKGKLKKKDNDLSAANGRIQDLEEELRNMVNKLSLLESEKIKFQSQLDETLPEVRNLREKLAEAKRNLDEEQLKSADLENTCARLDEDLKFKMQLLEKQLMEVKNRKEIEITERDGQLQEEYEDRLQKALEELREVYDTKMQQSREDIEKIYEDRVRDLQSQLSQSRGSSASTLQELKESKARIVALTSKAADLENANLALNQKIADLAQELEDLKGIHRSQLAAKDDEIKRLLDELANQLKAYQNLQDIKIALDMEIAVYRRLIEVEEDRLGINERSMDMSDSSAASTHSRTPPARVSVERTSESSYQRKVTVSQTSSDHVTYGSRRRILSLLIY